MYPTKMKVNETIYDINTDYRVALSCFDAINDETISDRERFYAVLCLLLGTKVKEQDEKEAYKKCEIFLRCGKDENPSKEEIDVDYKQDFGYINASFQSTYNIKINEEKMHWWEYNDYIAGFSEDAIMSKVREIRNKNINEIKDVQEREKLIKAKKMVEIKKVESINKTKEQEEIDLLFEKLL